MFKKPAGAPATSQQIKKAAKADISILAVGDCVPVLLGYIDAIRLEDEGTPTICICSHQFTSFAMNWLNPMAWGTADRRD